MRVIGPFVRTELADVESSALSDDDTDDDDVPASVKISVSGLAPATNYTLLIYAQNSHGRSPAALTVYATTAGQPASLRLPSPVVKVGRH